MRKTALLHIFLGLCLLFTLTGCDNPGTKTVLKVFEAGSLMVPFAEIEKAFEAKYPGIDVQMEGHGSIQVIRHITEIHQDIDIAAVADAFLIPMLMYQTDTPEGVPYADWTISFATNRLGIAYNKESKFAAEIDENNWYEILNRDGVRLGFSDPRLDAIGYRTLIMAQLAEFYYEDSGIFERLISQNFTPAIRSRLVDGKFNISVSELLESNSEDLLLRGFSIQLLSLLESREIDYAFEYESVARQHNLEFLELPLEIDLSSEQFADTYAQVQVSLDFKRFASVDPVFIGFPIIYGLTIQQDAPHKTEAAQFIAFLLGPEGQAIMRQNYHPPLAPATVDHKNLLPLDLQKLVN